MPSRRLHPDKEIARLIAEIRRLRLNLEALVQRIRDDRTAHYSTTAKRVNGSDRVRFSFSSRQHRVAVRANS